MARILLIATHGFEGPARAGLAFLFAKGAVEEGHQPEVILAGDAAVLARQTVAENVIPVGLPPLKDLMAPLLKSTRFPSTPEAPAAVPVGSLTTI